MVFRILEYSADLAANDTDVEADDKSPRDGQRWIVQELWATQEADVDMSLVLNERKLFDNITSTDLPDPDNGLRIDNLVVEQGDDLAVTMSETGGTDPAEQSMYIVVDEVSG